jgi:hypothetical protein
MRFHNLVKILLFVLAKGLHIRIVSSANVGIGRYVIFDVFFNNLEVFRFIFLPHIALNLFIEGIDLFDIIGRGPVVLPTVES